MIRVEFEKIMLKEKMLLIIAFVYCLVGNIVLFETMTNFEKYDPFNSMFSVLLFFGCGVPSIAGSISLICRCLTYITIIIYEAPKNSLGVNA